MKKIVAVISALLLLALLVFVVKTNPSQQVSPQGKNDTSSKVKPYEGYSFEKLAERTWKPSLIQIERKIADYTEYSSYVFFYQSEGRKISGQLNLPNLSRTMGVVVMARGYVEKEGYKTGVGTKNAADVYAKNGYITLAPDFSGYGESDPENSSALAARLTKPVEILDLLASLRSLPQVDLTKVYLWGHSNGGQIMLSVAEIIGMQEQMNKNVEYRVRGVTLWAPVSKPFPYNILFYTDEAEDQGKWLRSEIAKFEVDYDVYKYSIDRYLSNISIPVQIHQGSADDAVPKKWSDELSKKLEEDGKIATYYPYPGADHNMKPAWDSVVARDLDFFASN